MEDSAWNVGFVPKQKRWDVDPVACSERSRTVEKLENFKAPMLRMLENLLSLGYQALGSNPELLGLFD